MTLTLEEASKLSNDMLLQGVVETIVKESAVLQQLPFIEIVGNGLTYNQEKTLPGIDFYDVGTVLLWISIVLSIVSGVQYVVLFWRKISNQAAT